MGGTLKTEITARGSAGAGARRISAGVRAAPTSRRKKRRACFANWGCRYVSDPAVTRHLAAFLASAGDARPDAILFNGGFFIPEILRERVADVMEHWYGRRPVIFENRDLDLAVAVGAAYYSYVRETGAGLLVRGGLPRAYFIGLGGVRRRKRFPAHDVSGAARDRGRIDHRDRSGESAIGDEQAGVVSACTARGRGPKIKRAMWWSFRARRCARICICTRR